MSIIEKHRQLVADKSELQKRIVREEATLASVAMRMAELDAGSADWMKAREKRRHVDERLTQAREELIDIGGKLEHLRFEAEYE